MSVGEFFSEFKDVIFLLLALTSFSSEPSALLNSDPFPPPSPLMLHSGKKREHMEDYTYMVVKRR